MCVYQLTADFSRSMLLLGDDLANDVEQALLGDEVRVEAIEELRTVLERVLLVH